MVDVLAVEVRGAVVLLRLGCFQFAEELFDSVVDILNGGLTTDILFD